MPCPPDFFFVAYGQGRIQEGKMRGICIIPPAIFENVFDVGNFSEISSLFDCSRLSLTP